MNQPKPATAYTHLFGVKRRCKRCNTSKPTAGGKTYPGGRVWVCADCRRKVAA